MHKRIDGFAKNIIIVFVGTVLLNFLSLLYQLLCAHNFSVSEFAALNCLLSIFTVISSPLNTLQVAITKYCAQFNAQEKLQSLKFFISDIFKKALWFSLVTLVVFSLLSGNILRLLKIDSVYSGYILALLIASCWLSPVLLGAAQGLELFGWVSFTSAASGLLKLLLVFFFILVGYRTSGALFALFISSIAVVLILTFPLRQYINFKIKKEEVNYSKIFGYLVPVAIAQLCFMLLVNFDMLLVKYYFTAPLAGTYSFAQMVGKIFLFLPAAVSIVMFPKTSGLKVKNMDTSATLKRSLWYVFSLCLLALIAYNILPSLALRILTGRSYPETVLLGRAFSVSMSFFTLLYVLVCYFLSLDDFRFIRYLFGLTVLQIIAIALFHRSLIQVQLILCANAALAFLIHLRLAFSPSQKSSRI